MLACRNQRQKLTVSGTISPRENKVTEGAVKEEGNPRLSPQLEKRDTFLQLRGVERAEEGIKCGIDPPEQLQGYPSKCLSTNRLLLQNVCLPAPANLLHKVRAKIYFLEVHSLFQIHLIKERTFSLSL